VDDEVAFLRIMREALAASLRCEIDTSPKPEYGFELALKKKYDLLTFDFSMPMIDGAMLFFLIGKVYNNSEPPQKRSAAVARFGQGRRRTRPGATKGTWGCGIDREAFCDQPFSRQDQEMPSRSRGDFVN
jgi:hypothetical protein